jgi:hypothetical protein
MLLPSGWAKVCDDTVLHFVWLDEVSAIPYRNWISWKLITRE